MDGWPGCHPSGGRAQSALGPHCFMSLNGRPAPSGRWSWVWDPAIALLQSVSKAPLRDRKWESGSHFRDPGMSGRALSSGRALGPRPEQRGRLTAHGGDMRGYKRDDRLWAGLPSPEQMGPFSWPAMSTWRCRNACRVRGSGPPGGPEAPRPVGPGAPTQFYIAFISRIFRMDGQGAIRKNGVHGPLGPPRA